MGLFDAYFDAQQYAPAGPLGGLLEALARVPLSVAGNSFPQAQQPQATPDYGQTRNIMVGDYSMPQFGDPDPAAIPQNARPAIGQAYSMHQSPDIGDRLSAGFQGFANSDGLLPAISNLVSGLATGQRGDPVGIGLRNQTLTAQALAQRGIDPQLARVIAADPATMRAIIPQMIGIQPKTNDLSEYAFYSQQEKAAGREPKLFLDYMTTVKPGTRINNVNGGGDNKQVFDAVAEATKEARAAASGLNSLRTARSALQGPGGAITGFGADERLTLQKIGAYLGVSNADAIQNTETFRAAIAPQVAAMLKATVGTTNISNTDREFAERAAGGSIKLDAGSIARLLDIMEKAAVSRLELHQEQVNAVYPDPELHRRERALFSVKMPAADSKAAPAAPPAQVSPQTLRYNPKTKMMEPVR